MYREIQEEGSIILEVTVSAIVTEDIHRNMCLILKVTDTELFESTDRKAFRMVIKTEKLLTANLSLLK
jgi:hypothetical protein